MKKDPWHGAELPPPPPYERKWDDELIDDRSVRKVWEYGQLAGPYEIKILVGLSLLASAAIILPLVLVSDWDSYFHIRIFLPVAGMLGLMWAIRDYRERHENTQPTVWITNATCGSCGHVEHAVGLFDCECGQKHQIRRHIGERCPICKCLASFLQCPHCLVGQIEVWGNPPEDENGKPQWAVRKIAVTRLSGRLQPF